MINEHGEQMVEHHVKYLELHGVDETVWMTRSEHQQLHRRLRKEGKCNVPSDELAKIAVAACNRTEKTKEYNKNYNKRYEYNKSSIKLDDEPYIRLKSYLISRYGTTYGHMSSTIEVAITEWINRRES